MKTLLTCLAVCFLSFTLSAQRTPGGGGGGATTGRPNPTPMPGIGTHTTEADPDLDRPTFVYGKVVMADGSQIPEPATIESICGGHPRTEGYTDSHGSFSFELKKKPAFTDIQSSGDLPGTTADSQIPGSGSLQWHDCEIRAVLAGFTSETAQMAHTPSFTGSIDVGLIHVQSIGGVEPSSVLSVTSLAAPGKARKQVEKAWEEEHKGKTADAIEALKKAVEIYPRYAAAWNELGRLQYLQHDAAAAQHSYEQAAAADSKYAKPLLGLAQLAFEAHQWPQVLDHADKLLTLNATTFPAAWFYKIMAQLNLKQDDAAEKTARQAVKADRDHRLPRLEYLLGMILISQQHYPEAAEHMKKFLQTSSSQTDVTEARTQLARIEQLSASASSGAIPQK